MYYDSLHLIKFKHGATYELVSCIQESQVHPHKDLPIMLVSSRFPTYHGRNM